jgi:hypothetical protein
MRYYKQYIILFVWVYLTGVGGFVSAAETLMAVKPAVQSANSVVVNDCNLSITNAGLLEKIHGHTPATSLSANDIITAHTKTMEVCEWSSSKNPNQPWTTSMVENLCTLVIAKLEGNAEAISDRPSFDISKNLDKSLKEYGTNPNGTKPGVVSGELHKALGVARTQMPHSSPEKCGVISLDKDEWLETLYNIMSDAIYYIVTDCGNSIPYTARRMQNRISMLSSSAQTPYVFGVQQWGNYIDSEIQNCRSRLRLSRLKLNNAAQVASLKWSSNYTNNINKQWYAHIADQDATQSENLASTDALVTMDEQELTRIKQCNVAW